MSLRRPHLLDGLALLVVAATAFAARAAWAVNGHDLLTVGNYDDGVYFSGALALVRGHLPYADYLFLQPPGILLVLAPFGLLSRLTSDPVGFAASRVAWMLLGSLNAVLVSTLLARWSRPAAFCGGLAYALFWPAVYSDHITLLETLPNTALLAALRHVWRPPGRELRGRDVVVAGAWLGLGATVKIWSVVPVLVLAAWVWRRHSPARARALLLGALAGVVVVCAPFFLRAPTAMWRMVVRDQVGRPGVALQLRARITTILGLDLHRPPGGTVTTAVLVTALLVMALVVALAWRVPEHRLLVWLLAAMGAVLLASPSWFGHYGGFTGAVIPLLLGVAVGRLAELAGRRVPVLTVALTAALAGGMVLFSVPIAGKHLGQAFPTRSFTEAVKRGRGCVTGDDPTAFLLMNVLSRNLNRGCPLVLDPLGLHVQYQATMPRSAAEPAFRRAVLAYFASGQFFVNGWHSDDQGTGKATIGVLRRWPLVERWRRYELRRPAPPVPAGGGGAGSAAAAH